jgi:hypothetical protein
MFSQLPIPPPGAIENWLLPAAAVLYIASLAKKVFWSKPPARSEFITRAEFHAGLSSISDKIGEKIETLGTSIHTRLNQLEAGLARVDERTKK